MATVANPHDGGSGSGVGPVAHISSFLRTASAKVSSVLTLKLPPPPRFSLKIEPPPFLRSPLSLASPPDTAQPDSLSSKPSQIRSITSPEPGPEFPSGTRISTAREGEPAFVGRVYSICNGSGNNIIDASSHFHIPFLSQRIPDWLKEMFAATKSYKNGTGSRFFVDLDDAVSYLQEHHIPKGVVCNFDFESVFEHFKEKPHLVQFVSNERQVKEANRLLKSAARSGDEKRKLDGIPVFTSRNLDVVIETTNGNKRYTPYFFDKKLLDNILEKSVDSYFQSLIATRYTHRLGVDDHNKADEEVEEMGESTWDFPEVREALHEVSDDISLSDIPLDLVSKLAQNEVLYAVDKVLLGNRWFRKATGIQPKFPYVVDSFERKSAASFRRANNHPPVMISESEFDNAQEKQAQAPVFKFPFGDWLTYPWLNKQQKQQSLLDTRRREEEVKQSLFLPKVTIVDISTENSESTNSSSEKTVHGLMEGLEHEDQSGSTWIGSKVDERDPLFVADFESLSTWYSSPKTI